MTDKCREAFEAHITDQGAWPYIATKNKLGNYTSTKANDDWQLWQAAWNTRSSASPQPDDLVERVANAIWKITPSFGDMTWEEALEIYSGDNKLLVTIYRVMAEAALAAINLPAIRAQARKEALEEVKAITDTADGWEDGETFYKDAVMRIRNLIEKEG